MLQDKYEITSKFRRKYQLLNSAKVEIGLVLTKYCPVGCRHCINKSSLRKITSPPLNILHSWITKVADTGEYKAVNITGGEPFAKYNLLLNTTRTISKFGIYPTVVTSAHWADNDRKTSRMLKQLVRSGMYAISVSIDKYHQEKIPLINAARVVRISYDLGMNIGLSLTYFTSGDENKKLISEMEKYLSKDTFNNLEITGGKLIQSGRARSLNFQPDYEQNIENPRYMCSHTGLVILENGLVAGCCGADLPPDSPLVIGDLNKESMQAIKKRFDNNPLIPFIEIWGLNKMLEVLKPAGLGVPVISAGLQSDANICNTCRQIFARKENVFYFKKLMRNPAIRKEMAVKSLILRGNTSRMINGYDFE
jgi:MoaA/NifB/PqqE/SkfB family radical SAM enzyme